MIGLIRRLWRRKWNLARLLVAGFLLWVVATDTAARMARLRLAALPGFDFAAEIRALRLQGRYGEAAMVAKEGLADRPDLVAAERDAIEREAALTAAEQSSWIRRAKDAGLGALSGRATSLEGLIGALAADFFVVGDVRDLVIEGGKLALDGDADELVLLLSVAGVVTTVAPEIDWAPAVLKAARKAGAVSERFAAVIASAIKGRRIKELEPIFEDVARVSKRASPGGAVRVLRLADSPEDLRSLARFVERQGGTSGVAGAFALHVTGERGARLLKAEGEGAERVVVLAARKGRAGSDLLLKPAARVLTRPHAIVGLLKGLRKGTLADAVAKFIERLDSSAWWIVPLLAAWTFVEGAMLVGGLVGRRDASAAGTARVRASRTRSTVGPVR